MPPSIVSLDLSGSTASARSSREGDTTPQVQVEVPDSWQQQRKAGELARSGYRALAEKRYGQAVERLSKARRLAPDRTDVINNLGLAQWQAGSPGKAIQTLTDGLGKYPDNPRMAQNLAHFLLRRGDEGDRETGVQALTNALEAQDRLPLYALVGAGVAIAPSYFIPRGIVPQWLGILAALVGAIVGAAWWMHGVRDN